MFAIGQTGSGPTSRLEARRRAQEASLKVIEVLRSEGYYDYTVTPDIGEGDAPQPFVTVKLGPRAKIKDPRIEWVDGPPSAVAQAAANAAMKLEPGSPGRAASVMAAQGRIVAALRSVGYANASADAGEPFKPFMDHADSSLQPTFRISAGSPVRLDGVVVAGHTRTSAKWIARLAPWKRGDAYRPEAVAELERRLVDAGTTDSVSVSLAPADQEVNGARPVIVNLVDRPAGRFEFGASYSSTEGFGLDSRWLVYNRLGQGETITTTLQVAQIDSRLQTELSLPDWRRARETLKMRAAVFRDNTKAYDERAIAVSSDLTFQYGRTTYATATDCASSGGYRATRPAGELLFCVTYGGSLEQSDTTEKELANFVTLSRHRRLTTLGGLTAVNVDESNDQYSPTRGWRLGVRLEPTLSGGDGAIVYLKASGQGSTYLPLDRNDDTVIALRGKLGAIAGGNIPRVPAPQRFYSGGGGSVRGYAYQAVGPRYPDNTPKGGLSVVETSAELRRVLTQNWGIAAFVDAGAAGGRVQPDFRHPDIGVGFGVRYNLSASIPIRVDFGTPLHRRAGDSPLQIYLSLGQSF